MSTAYVVCCIFLQTFQTYILYIGKQCGPRSERSSLIWVHTVCNNDFLSSRQKTKQTTIVVIGALRVNTCWVKISVDNIFKYFTYFS